MDPFVSDLVNALIVAMVPVGIGALGFIARGVVSYLKARVGAEQYALIEKIATATVASLEMSLKGKAGQEKKDAAMALVRAECLKRGIRLDEAAIGNAIEAAVYRSRLEAPAL